jgi:tRNA U34 5-methylaminomethyl-2-thiouridine-forming methyltransferase MnmC
MPARRPQRTIIPTHNPKLVIVVTDDGSRTLRYVPDSTTWHSESGALAESRLVFLENSRVAELLANGIHVRVFEVGFGTGLNFWITANMAMQYDTSLEYVCVEPAMLPRATIDALDHAQLNECKRAFHSFARAVFDEPEPGTTSTTVRCQNVALQIIHLGFEHLMAEALTGFDAVYHDPFDPATAPELWTRVCFDQLYRLSRPGGRLVTYCVKSEIQQRLQSAGFEVGKTRGPAGGKREVLVAEKPCNRAGRSAPAGSTICSNADMPEGHEHDRNSPIKPPG